MEAMKKADINQDKVVTSSEFNNLSDADKVKFQNFLKKQGKWDAFVEAKRIKYEEKVQAQAAVTKEAHDAEVAHRKTVGEPIAGTQFLADAQAGKTVEGNESNNTG